MEIRDPPQCSCTPCDQPGLLGYRDQGGTLVWYCSQHRRGQFWADARWGDPESSGSASAREI
jgi:hypothetical protein